MEEQTKGQIGGQHPEGCKCPMCQGKMCGMGGCCSRHDYWYHALRLILGIVVIVIVFWLGMMLGQIKGELGVGSGRRMMRVSYNGSAYPMMRSGQGGMMGGQSGVYPTASTTNQ